MKKKALMKQTGHTIEKGPKGHLVSRMLESGLSLHYSHKLDMCTLQCVRT